MKRPLKPRRQEVFPLSKPYSPTPPRTAIRTAYGARSGPGQGEGVRLSGSYGGADAAELIHRELREERQGQHLFAGLLRLRQPETGAGLPVQRLLVQRHRVIDTGGDPLPFQRAADCFPARTADHVKMERVSGSGHLHRTN